MEALCADFWAGFSLAEMERQMVQILMTISLAVCTEGVILIENS